ncbi:prohead protease [Vibrio phage 1.072.O._10N.286.48.A12]|nr:prohead protease [Vibrio phage 1.004.O._10N.261.54.A2]AUR83567.1 prohead protease [Vibrio phage 1.037.O._10N.261.52.F7]AUR84450.1 prohead protease [Vibrio phage 1.056.O._10N.261.48.C11]AUR84967.1 prohead protease [Vibrio phage 1.066.O._10N.286.46.E8]AUR85098.1 prohead protease [Vibrio phage 1.068.O._10N.261.51.F8]AUR85325.1 prohead protease [Vibrio phage 1.072.O._10N.286.48.A12]
MSQKIIQMTDFKVKSEKDRSFTCYGNVKGNIDHALDRTLDGAYQDSIDEHKANGTMPKMFWNHQSWELPVGTWPHMEEDSTGLLLEGKMSSAGKGGDIFTLMQEGAVDSFSIGYRVIEEKWNSDKRCNDLIKLNVMEISPVNFACNELSTLQSIQKSLREGDILSKSDLRQLLQMSQVGLSKRQIENITCRYHDEKSDTTDVIELGSLLANASFCK